MGPLFSPASVSGSAVEVVIDEDDVVLLEVVVEEDEMVVDVRDVVVGGCLHSFNFS